jgi:hypothetical protein
VTAKSKGPNSIEKSTILAGLCAAMLLATWLWASSVVPPRFALPVVWIAGLLGATAFIFFAAGLVVVYRQHVCESGETDLFLRLGRSRREDGLESSGDPPAHLLRRALAKWLLGHDFLVGDPVEVLSLAEIKTTLDERGMCDGVPFMPEMARFAGRSAVR